MEVSSVKVSVYLTSYNRPQWIAQAIESVLGQTLHDIELVILDDNSSDPKVWEIIDSYDDNRIIKYNSHISEDMRYKSTARYATLINTGAKLSSGEFMSYLGDDDYYAPNKLEKMYNYATENGYEVVYSSQLILNVDNQPINFRPSNRDLVQAGGIIDHNSVMNSRKVYDEVGGWDDSRHHWMHADSIFFDRIRDHGYIFKPVPDPEMPLDFKRHHNESVQIKLHTGCFPENTWPPS